jgi:hypothetical protein
MRQRRLTETMLVVATVAFTVVLSEMFQTRLTVGGGFGWDGVDYAKLAEEARAGAAFHANAPFCFRLLVPLMVGEIFGATLNGFLVINTIASAAACFLLLLWLRRHVDNWLVRAGLVAVYATSWMGPLRFDFWAPATSVDGAFLAFLLGAMLCVPQKRSWRDWPSPGQSPIKIIGSTMTVNAKLDEPSRVGFHHVATSAQIETPFPLTRIILLTSVMFLGTICRESMLLVPAILLPAALLDRDRPRVIQAAVAGGAGALGLAITHQIVHPDNHFGPAGMALWWAYNKPVPVWLHGAFIAYGPLIALVLARPCASVAYLRDHKELAIWLGYSAGLAWIGGSDTERFFFWSFPVVLVLAGRALLALDLRHAWLPCAVTALAQAISDRLFWSTPDWRHIESGPHAWPLLTPIRAIDSALLSSNSPDWKMAALSLAQYVALCAVLTWWLRRSAPRMVAP